MQPDEIISEETGTVRFLIILQTIIVTTRPLLFCCLKKAFEAPKEVGALVSSSKIRPLLTMSLDASQKILNILESLQDQDLLGMKGHS